MVIELLRAYLKITETVYAAICAKDMDIVDTQLLERKQLLSEIQQQTSIHEDQETIDVLLNKIKDIEEKVEIEVSAQQERVLNERNTFSGKKNALKRSNKVVQQYKYGSMELMKSRFDKKK